MIECLQRPAPKKKTQPNDFACLLPSINTSRFAFPSSTESLLNPSRLNSLFGLSETSITNKSSQVQTSQTKSRQASPSLLLLFLLFHQSRRPLQATPSYILLLPFDSLALASHRSLLIAEQRTFRPGIRSINYITSSIFLRLVLFYREPVISIDYIVRHPFRSGFIGIFCVQHLGSTRASYSLQTCPENPVFVTCVQGLPLVQRTSSSDSFYQIICTQFIRCVPFDPNIRSFNSN